MNHTSKEDVKIVMVLAPHLEKGPLTNRAAVLATGLVGKFPAIVGKDVVSKDGQVIPGITQIPIPILAARPGQSLKELAAKGQGLGCSTLVFITKAQGLHSYNEYEQYVSQTAYVDIEIDAIALHGPKKLVDKVTGNLPMLR